MKFENLLELIKVVSESDLTNFKYEDKETKISMGSGAVPVAVSKVVEASAQVMTQTPASAEEIPTAIEGNIVKSPLVGTFYAAPSEDAKAYVQVGDTVKKGQTLAIIEAMKLMNDIECEFDGTVTEVLTQNGTAVEYGQPLFRIS